MATSIPDVISSNQPDAKEIVSKAKDEALTVVFDIHGHTNKKKQQVPQLTLTRNRSAKLRDLTEHLETQLFLPSGHGRKLLLLAKCGPSSKTGYRRMVPLVCEEIWAAIFQQHPDSNLEISVDQHRQLVVTHARSCREWLFGRQIKNIDIPSYLPSSGLAQGHIFNLCHSIFEKRVSIKHSLRKGVWMHLVGVFPPELKERDERERYIEKLRMVYDSLKGKWKGEQGAQSAQVEQLVEAVRRDAVRTDPSHPFYTRPNNTSESLSPDSIANVQDQSNIQKLINIVTIYILEHEGVSYTQGMTDLLSPFLYVMKREADAYICFAAMVERIKSHFNTWCEGTLLKIERLRHICEVLDPELSYFLTNRIEEDAFVLFFGMVLIECRREFSFDDSFQLLEAIWAGAMCMKGEPPETPAKSKSEWAGFMTYDSVEVIQQAFGETQSPYSARPLPRSYSDTNTSIAGTRFASSRNPSMLSQASVGSQIHRLDPSMPEVTRSSNTPSDLSINGSANDTVVEPVHSIEIHRHTIAVDIESDEVEPFHGVRPRSYTDPNLAHEFENRKATASLGLLMNLSPSHLSTHSHSESELYDSFSNSRLPISTVKGKTPTELADMSSVSSDAVSTSGNHQSPQSEVKAVENLNTNDSSQTAPELEAFYHDHQEAESAQSNGIILSSPIPPPRSASSAYLTANDGSPSSQSSQSQSPHLRRAVRKGERITTESIPDESHVTSDSQSLSRNTHSDHPQLISLARRSQSPLTLDGGHQTDDTDGTRSRITPVAFFDAMGTIASSVPGTNENSGAFEHSELSGGGPGHSRHIRVNSDVSMIMSQLNLGDQANPRVTRERSLAIPVSDCFSLFVCMAILSQHRLRIMQPSTDFVGLSVILNTQAGRQNVEKTLYIARDLYRIYKDYQMGYNVQSLDTWLDANCSEGLTVSNGHSRSGPNDNRRNSTDSTDSVFNS